MSNATIFEAVRVIAIDGRHRSQLVIEAAVARCAGARLVAQAASGADGVAACERLDPHVVVLDRFSCSLPADDLVAEVRRVAPDARIVTFRGSDHGAQELLADADVHGIAEDGCDAALLAEVLRSVHVGLDTGIVTAD